MSNNKTASRIRTAAFVTLAAAGLSSSASAAPILFSFQQGDLRQDGVLFGPGASYTGNLTGSINDVNPTKVLTATTNNRVGAQFNTISPVNANIGTDGRAFNALFSYDLAPLQTYLTANPSKSVSEAAFRLTGSGGSSSNGFANTYRLYQTVGFTSSATWSTSDGTNAWPTPLRTNTGGVSGGGTQFSGQLATAGSTPTVGAVMSFNTSTDFVAAINNALARGDKTLYLVAQHNYSNWDSWTSFYTHLDATVSNRPELLITVVPEPATLGVIAACALLTLRRRMA